jgi:apolipoprotein N-acyltransferase
MRGWSLSRIVSAKALTPICRVGILEAGTQLGTVEAACGTGHLTDQQTSRAPRHWGRRVALAVASAFGLTLSMPPAGWWWAAPLAVAALILAVRNAALRVALAVGAIGGTVWTFTALSWLASVGPVAHAGMAVVMGVWWAILAVAIAVVQRLRWWPVLVPGVWVLLEQARSSWPLGGFPWGRLAFAALDSPVVGLAPVTGTAGTTFVVAAMGSAFAAVVVAIHSRQARRFVVLGVMATGTVMALAGLTLSDAVVGPETEASVRVAALQGGPVVGVTRADEARRVLQAHVRQSRSIGEDMSIDLVVWPESSSDIDPFLDASTAWQISSAVDEVGAPAIVGVVTRPPDQVAGPLSNEAVTWLPGTGPVGRYAKRKLVPFGEVVPARSLLSPWIDLLGLPSDDFQAGTEPGLLSVGNLRAGVLLCFEVAFDDAVRSTVLSGAELLVIPSNNATYSGSTEPEQQLAMARFRALEFDRSITVASTTGPSALILPNGAVAQRIDDGEAGAIVADLPVRTTTTWAAKWGSAFSTVLVVLGFTAVLTAFVRMALRVPPAAAGVSCNSPRTVKDCALE